MLPEGWNQKTLSEICDKQISYGIVQTGSNISEGVPCLRVVDLTKSKMNPEEMIKTSLEIHHSYKKTILVQGEIVMALRGEVGLVRMVNKELSGANITRGLARLSAKQNTVAPSFLLWLLRSPKFRADLIRRVGGSALQEISLTELRKVKTLIPPLPEQKKIAQILSTWDNAILATERLLDNSQQRKKALMQQLLTGKKRLPNFEGEWSKVELGDLGYTYGGLTGKAKEDFGSGEPYITYMSVFADGAIIPDKFDYVKLKEGEKQHSVEYGDILFTTSSETPEEVGMASVMLERLPFNVYLNSFCFGFRLSSLDVLIPEYAKYYMRSESIRRAIANLAQGATRYNLSKKQLLKISLHLPSISEQQTIANILTTADQEIDALQKRLDHLKLEKKSLMQQLLTGKRRVLVDTAA